MGKFVLFCLPSDATPLPSEKCEVSLWVWDSHSLTPSFLPYLCQRCPGVLDLDFAIVGDGGPDGDGLAGNVAAAVESHPTRHRALRPTRQPDLVFDLAVEGLLQEMDDITRSRSRQLYRIYCILGRPRNRRNLKLIDFFATARGDNQRGHT